MKKNLLIIMLVIGICTFSGMAIGAGTQISNAKKSMEEDQLKAPLSQADKKLIEKAVDEFLKDKILDTIWKKTFHFHSFFDSTDGWETEQTGSGTGTVAYPTDKNAVVITTGATSGDTITFKKQVTVMALVTFNQRSYFRTSLQMVTSVANETIYAVVGDLAGSFYGFKIAGTEIYGVSSNNGTANEKTVLIRTGVTTGVSYVLEARYTPSSVIGQGKIVFFEGSTGSTFDEKGTIVDTSKMPLTSAVVNEHIGQIKVSTAAAAAKDVVVSHWEYFQERNVLK